MDGNLGYLQGITYSEFDNALGPSLKYSYPDNVLSDETFEILSEYIIVGQHLCKKIITVCVNNRQYLNYSMAINDQKYDRNTFTFSFGLVSAYFLSGVYS